jgi:hypothetical protein
MSELIIVNADSSGLVVLSVPPLHEIRVVAVFAQNLTPTDGDTVTVSFRRGPEFILRATSGPLQSTVSSMSGSLNGDTWPPYLLSFVVATGVQVYAVSGTANSMKLPDIWWPWDIIVRTTIPTGSQ